MNYHDAETPVQGWQIDTLTNGYFRWIRSFRLYAFPMATCWYWGISNIVGDVCDCSDEAKVYAEGALAGLLLGGVSDLLSDNSSQIVSDTVRGTMADLELKNAR